jgi:tetratricopeptide (TPR) repeat protein
LSDESVPDDFTVSWIDGDVKDEFLPARPRTAVPDPRDGVPEALDPLEWEEAQDESTVSAPASRNFSTSVDGGTAQHDAGQTENAAEEAQPESDYRPLNPLAAAGAITAAIRKAIARNDGDDAGKQADPAQTQASGDPALSAAAPAAPAESAPQQTRADSKATAAIKAEVESASVKPMPINAVEYVDEDMDRWAGDEGGAALETAQADQPASVNEPLQPAQTAAPAKSTPAQTVAAAQEAPAAPAANAENNDVLPKVLAAAATLGVVKKKHKKREAENAKAEENASIAPAAEDETATVAQSAAPSVPAEPEQDDMNPAEDAAPAAKPAKPKRAKKPAKPAARETQTEKVRKTYERAIATARREDIPKLIAELNQATEVDPDNKIIYELLGQAYNRSGDIPAAINAYRRALSLAERS